ncbi:MAG: aminoglycoside phosphotransferase family protein [Lachnospiraceae bacterium]
MEAVKAFQLEGKIQEVIPYGNGHINDTYLITTKTEQGDKRYVLQKMNRSIFKNPEELMENIVNVTNYLREQIVKNGGNPLRETLNVVNTVENKSFYKDETGEYYRMYYFIENAVSLEQVTKPEEFYESAVAFGRFQKMLANYPADSLHATIENFHKTSMRLENLKQAVEEDAYKRAAKVKQEIEFIMNREKEAGTLDRLLKEGQLPLRVTHNDTKLNNVMLDNHTKKGICVIDLDTVMPGLSLHDFGDAIRFGASTAAEDEKDLRKVSCSMELYQNFVRGFLKECGSSLTKLEIELLPMGAKIMTLECGIRFLTDYLQGDVYFKTHREAQNLDRCRTQLKLVQDMEEKWEKMQQIIAEQQQL